MDFDLLIVGAGPGGIFSAYEAMKLNPELKIALFETGNPQEPFLMENTISPTSLAVPYTNISEGKKQLI